MWQCALAFLLLFLPLPAAALEPDEVMVISNADFPESVRLARYYMKQRDIPGENHLALHTVSEERCSRDEYERAIRAPVRQQLDRLRKKKRIRCLVLLYGIPLRINPSPPEAALDDGQAARQNTDTGHDGAAVDSELALVLSDGYPLSGWLPNPYFLGFQGQNTLLHKDRVLMTARLDGPDPAIVRRLIDDALASDRRLRGRACIDARWPPPAASDPPEKKLDGYALYDAALHKLAGILQTDGRFPVHLEQSGQLLPAGDCPDTAIYCGWYSLANYVPAFTWTRGSVGYHIASSEASTLRNKASQVWCKRMLEEGIAATIGPVDEPFVQAFPLPDLFFAQLVDGYLSLAECYLTSLPFLSWQMILIGDPLYQPFPQSVSEKDEPLAK